MEAWNWSIDTMHVKDLQRFALPDLHWWCQGDWLCASCGDHQKGAQVVFHDLSTISTSLAISTMWGLPGTPPAENVELREMCRRIPWFHDPLHRLKGPGDWSYESVLDYRIIHNTHLHTFATSHGRDMSRRRGGLTFGLWQEPQPAATISGRPIMRVAATTTTMASTRRTKEMSEPFLVKRYEEIQFTSVVHTVSQRLFRSVPLVDRSRFQKLMLSDVLAWPKTPTVCRKWPETGIATVSMPVNAVRFRFVSITRHFPSRDSGLSHELNPGLVEFDSIHGSMRWISPTFNDFQHKALHAVIISRILGDMGKKMWPKNGGGFRGSFKNILYRSVKQGFFWKIDLPVFRWVT